MLLRKKIDPTLSLSPNNLTDEKNSKKLSARWKLVDGKLICFWSIE